MKKWTGAPWSKFIASSQKAISREKEKLKDKAEKAKMVSESRSYKMESQ